MLELILNSYQYITELSLFIKIIIILLFSIISPIMVIPIMATMYLSGLILGVYTGLITATIGYILSIFIYYYIGRSFNNISFIKRFIDLKLEKYKNKLAKMDFIHIILFSLFVPFLLISIGLGVLHKRRINILAVYLGAFPSIVAFVLAGNYGKNFFEAQDNDFIYYSIGLVVLYVTAQKIFTLYLKKKG